ncbi:MAG: hypothetical protein ACOX87_10900 [Chloroflexota bacterium]|jgi:hypothetical protein
MAHSNKGRQGGKSTTIAAKNVTEEDIRFLEKYGDRLSDTTLRAKWIHNVDEHEDKPGQSLATRSHEVIKQWAEERGAQPATVPGTEHEGRPGVLRFNFPGYGGQSLQLIDWEDWFRSFDERDLVFVYQEHQSGGNLSNFFMMDSPHREHE